MNINTGYNDDLINKSYVLKGYCTFIELIDKYVKNYLLGSAIDKAIQDCINMGILAEFFREQGGEVKKVIELDYTFEAQLATERKDKEELMKQLADKDAELADKDAELADKDAELADKDAELADKDAELADKDAELADKDAELADKDAELADKDAKLADKDAELEKMRALLRENGIL